MIEWRARTQDMPNYCDRPMTSEPHPSAAQPRITYLRWNVAYWSSAGSRSAERLATPAATMEFVQKLFTFVDAALASGGSVLVHCLAGAHRAGTTGCLLLMYKANFDADQATKTAKVLRPVINPIGNLPGLLRLYEQCRNDVPR